MGLDSFIPQKQLELGQQFLTQGYVIAQASDSAALHELETRVRFAGNQWLMDSGRPERLESLELSHEIVDSDVLNSFRLSVFGTLNADPSTRELYYLVGQSTLETIVGNELAMQTKVNLSIQQPRDDASVLDIHSDVWTGDSPFQVVLWVPLADTRDSNGMFFLPPGESAEALGQLRSGRLRSMREAYDFYERRIKTLELKFGEVLVFNSNCLHGNKVNCSKFSRWSLNCRFITLMAPSINPERRLGSYYSPITMRPATKMGLESLKVFRRNASNVES
jgi:sporadic carbohydrate cluster 2OG-Fe(II) oxygenase